MRWRYCERIVALRQGHVFYDGSSQQFDNERFDHLYRSINRVEGERAGCLTSPQLRNGNEL
ncbi:phosphonate/organophosphate ester transporter subunit [Kluyvera cryocrescens]|uniref:Phosphonate/organophosphate ester transporter subunit n=1 Tax=Kluyvera cryocrescens TaxID=580 RepID=A0A485AIN5_KLUCR|nr:phosphonate/organophosphate ester transporter subunit [Kluyvera cryocrescens]